MAYHFMLYKLLIGQVEMSTYLQDVEQGFQEEEVVKAEVAISSPEHRNHIVSHLRELFDMIKNMEVQSDRLQNTAELTIRQTEEIAEHIDEQVSSICSCCCYYCDNNMLIFIIVNI